MQSEPTWMYDNYELFKDLTLGDLTLVYTHDAAAYKYNTRQTSDIRFSKCVVKLRLLYPTGTMNSKGMTILQLC